MIWEILPNVFTLVAHLTFYELIFEGCALCIISVTSPECWCAFLLHLCSNSLFTEEKGGQQPLLYLEQYIIFSLNEEVFKDLSGNRLRFPPPAFFIYYYLVFIKSLALSSLPVWICLLSDTYYRKLSAEECMLVWGEDEGWEHHPALINLAQALECSHSFFFQTSVLSLLQNMKVKVHLMSCPCPNCLKLSENVVGFQIVKMAKDHFFMFKWNW